MPKRNTGRWFLISVAAFFVSLCVVAWFGPGGQAAPGAKSFRRVLVVTGIDYPGHKWRLTAPLVTRILLSDPRLYVDMVSDPDVLGRFDPKRYSALVLHFMNWKCPAPGKVARARLKKFVSEGGGLVLIHFACGAFGDWPEFRNLAGRVWDPNLRPHDPRGPFRVEIVDHNHPVTQGLSDFETNDELYTCLAGERPIELLARAKSKVDGRYYPMAFVFTYGKGRVFHTPLGHDVKALSVPAVGELLRRGCAWVCGLPPALPKAKE